MVYLASGGFWLITAQITLTLLGFVTAIAFGHFAAQDTYGNYKYVLTLAGLFSAFSLSGIASAVTQAASRSIDGVLAQGFRLSMRWSLGFIAVSMLASFYYLIFERNVFLSVSCLIIACFGPLLNSASLYSPYLAGKKEFKRETIYDILDGLFPAVILIATLFFTDRAIVLIVIYFLTNTAAALFFYFRSTRVAHNNATDPELLHYSQHLSIMGLVNAIADKIDSVSVFAFLGPAQLAIYAYAIALPEQIKVVIKLIIPLSLSKFAQRSLEEIDKHIWQRIGMLFLAATLTVLLYIAATPLIFRILFPIYTDSILYSQWYSLSIIFSVIVFPFNAIFQAHKKTRQLYIVSNGSSILLIIMLPFFAYYYGIVGVIASQFIYRALSAGLTAWQYLSMRRA